MSKGSSLKFTASAIADFRLIFGVQSARRARELLEEMGAGSLQLIKEDGSRVYRAPRYRHYLLVSAGPDPVCMAVGPPTKSLPRPPGRVWWIQDPGDRRIKAQSVPRRIQRDLSQVAPEVLRLEALGKERGLGYRKVAELAGLSESVWRSLRKGTATEGLGAVRRLLAELDPRDAPPRQPAESVRPNPASAARVSGQRPNALRTARLSVGVSRRWLSELCGVPEREIRRLEEDEGDGAQFWTLVEKLERVRAQAKAEQIAARAELGLSQEAFAAEIGVHRVTVSEWERQEAKRIAAVIPAIFGEK